MPNATPATPRPAGTNAVKMVYICPMPEHVSIEYDHPGKCPICGMTLVPVSQATLEEIQPGGKILYYTCPMPEHSDVHRRQARQMPQVRHDADPGDGRRRQPLHEPMTSDSQPMQSLIQRRVPMRQDRQPLADGMTHAGLAISMHRAFSTTERSCSKASSTFRSRTSSSFCWPRWRCVLGGLYAVRNIPLDAIPDLSDVQVIIYTRMARPGAANRPGPGHLSHHDQDALRAQGQGRARLFLLRLLLRLCDFRGRHRSLLGAQPRARISQRPERAVAARASPRRSARTPPASAGPSCIRINSTNRDLAELRSMQDWYLRYQLASVEGVSEVASVGGFVKQYQVTVDPPSCAPTTFPLSDVAMAVKRSNGEVGGRSIEMAEKEFILRVKGYVQSLDDLRKVAVGVGRQRRADPAGRGRQRATRPRHAARHRRVERRRRNRRRHRRRALRRQCAAGHSRREKEARPGDEGPCRRM